MRFAARALIVTLLLSVLTTLYAPAQVFAQSTSNTYVNSGTVNPYNVPDTDPNVPANQHTRIQSILIDLMSSTVCILIGVDPVNKNQPCLDINPKTGKLGYNNLALDPSGQQRVGGLLGASSQMIAMLYTPTVSVHQYSDYLSANFGIVKTANAQGANDPGYGFTGLNALLGLWTAVRNIAYFMLMVAFVLIGLGVMLRVKIDPRTVMTLQNQIPRIIICIILITGSYPIAGFMVDTMWVVTYVGINVITQASGINPNIPGDNTLGADDPNRADGTLSQRATVNLLQSPLTYVNQIFRSPDTPDSGNKNIDSGVGHIADEVSYSVGAFLGEIIKQLLGVANGDNCGFLNFSFKACIGEFLGYLAGILMWIIILFMVLKALFSVWFTLIKAYTYIIIYTIASPIFIVLGLLPGKPLGIEKWLRSMAANLAPFPATVWMFLLARIFVELFNTPAGAPGAGGAGTATQFIPPLIGNPNILHLLGWIIAFGILMMTPTVLLQWQEALKVPGNKYGGAAIGGAVAAAAAAPKAFAGNMWSRATRKADLHQDSGILRKWAAGSGEQKEYGKARNFVQRLRFRLDKYNPHGKTS